ncbi:MAG: hypothetical protein IKI88_08215 [Anaerotignum sp.]|nr:hypothetical protein [Anaerotignum sp.]
MFTSFNSLPLYTAHSLEEQGALRELLEKNGIEYSVSLRDMNAPEGFYPALSPELLLTQNIAYTFLVYKKDWQKAKDLLNTQWHWEEE